MTNELKFSNNKKVVKSINYTVIIFKDNNDDEYVEEVVIFGKVNLQKELIKKIKNSERVSLHIAEHYEVNEKREMSVNDFIKYSTLCDEENELYEIDDE